MNFSFRILPVILAAAVSGITASAAGQGRLEPSGSIYQRNDFLRTLVEQRIRAGGGVTTVQVTGASVPRNSVKLDFISQTERRQRTDLGYGSIQSPAGTYGIEGHGRPDALYFRNGGICPPQELAKWIRGDSRYRQGMTIYLFACETGKGSRSYAQRLANEMGATVVAPTEKLWISTGGGYYVAAEGVQRLLGFIPAASERADRSRSGEMRSFKPSVR